MADLGLADPACFIVILQESLSRLADKVDDAVADAATRLARPLPSASPDLAIPGPAQRGEIGGDDYGNAKLHRNLTRELPLAR
ncbi:hypothetical protein SETIT_3G304300v2 [Setaria italica]|uniref:Uncharacterized protein n=1 Tax=Setaria italica TaxID=4555 RepID=A0A368QKP1_SETIT|nr:hypothetical protein SETIT_3G304300v2 [Setaria italica]